jgi:hypothetical protein
MASRSSHLPTPGPQDWRFTVDDRRISPAGDPFYAAALRNPDQDRPHACWQGWVYLGFEEEEDGEIVAVTDRVPCRRCNGRG